ncbi:MAG: DUF1996 domain-containing protein [Steroidobacteraceae bacterium]
MPTDAAIRKILSADRPCRLPAIVFALAVFLVGCASSASSPPATAAISGRQQTQQVTLPAVADAVVSPPIVVPAEEPGSPELRVRATSLSVAPASDGVGAFRIPCSYSHMAYDDPILLPGEPGKSHLHTFFGNSSTNSHSTEKDLANATAGTCRGGIANRTSYWIPSMIDAATHTALVPSDALFYYKSGYNSIPRDRIQPIPAGLRMIAGKKPTASAGDPDWKWDRRERFHCDVNGEQGEVSETIPNCPAGSKLSLSLIFPNCWDGVSLDSPDHRSHMSFPENGLCPASHPVAIPTVTLNIAYAVPAGSDTSRWRLSSDMYPESIPAGYSFHGDIWFNWNEDVMNTWLKNCVRAGNDCHAFLLGDGREVY